MEKVAGDTSPRSTLGWRDDSSGSESSGPPETTFSTRVLERSKSLVGVLDSDERSKSLVRVTRKRSKSFEGFSTAENLVVPKIRSLPLERRLFESPSPPLNADRPVCGSLVIRESPSSSTEGPAAQASEQPPISGSALQIAVSENVAEPVWGQDGQTEISPFSLRSSAVFSSARDDSNSNGTTGDDMWSVTDSSDSSAAVVARGRKGPPSDRLQFVNSLNEELTSIKASVRRAIDLGKTVQHYGALEASQLRGEKMNAEASVQKSVLLNRDLEKQVTALRDEVQKVQWERELEVMTMNDEMQELETERNILLKAARGEKRKREKLQNEIDSILSVLLEEKMKLETEREAHEAVLLNERKRLHSMRKARDAAMKALEEGNKKLNVERDVMLMAMRDLTSRLDFERDAKLRSMRRSSLDVANMISNLKLSGRNSISGNDATPSRQNSRQFQ